MTKEVEIEALAPFNRHDRGDLCEVGDRFPVTDVRADQLEASRLARRTKAAPKPDNKMAPEPSNKKTLGRKPLPITPKD